MESRVCARELNTRANAAANGGKGGPVDAAGLLKMFVGHLEIQICSDFKTIKFCMCARVRGTRVQILEGSVHRTEEICREMTTLLVAILL